MKTKDEIFKLAYCRQRMKGTVTGEGDLDRIRRSYQFRRKNRHTVTSALGLALVSTITPSYYEPDIGAPDDRGYRCVTKPGAFGLRFVNYSDEMVSWIRHKGWYTDTEGRDGEVYRGCVWQLPGKDKQARYVAGYHDVAADCYLLDFSNIFVAAPLRHPDDRDDDVLEEAARAGDSEAERDAEKCRDYDHQWQAANRWQELQDTLTGLSCECISAEDERDRLREEIREIEREFLDIAEFARNNL